MSPRRLIAEHHQAALEQELAAAARHAFGIQRRSVMALVSASPRGGIAIGGSAQSLWDQQAWADLVAEHVVPAAAKVAQKAASVAGASVPKRALWGAPTDSADAAAASVSDRLIVAGAAAGDRIDNAGLAGNEKQLDERLDGAGLIVVGLAAAGGLVIVNATSSDTLSQLDGASMTWNAIDDDRTREAHADTDGQTVAIGQPFDVDGEDLAYPGDPAGSDENVMNCRCWVTGDAPDLGGG